MYSKFTSEQDFVIKDVFQFGKIDTYAFFLDGSKLHIEIDKNGHPFFYIKNPFSNDSAFHKSTKNAVNAIRQGYGDMLCKSSIGGIRVRHYIDRTIGETYRKETIAKWRDEPFDYVIKIHDETMDFASDKTILCDYTAQEECVSKQPMVFDTKEDAEVWWNQLIEECQGYAKGFVYQMNEQYNAKCIADAHSKEYPPDEELTDEELIKKYDFEAAEEVDAYRQELKEYNQKLKQRHLDDCLYCANWVLTNRIEKKYQTKEHISDWLSNQASVYGSLFFYRKSARFQMYKLRHGGAFKLYKRECHTPPKYRAFGRGVTKCSF